MINKEQQKRNENPRIQNSERYHQITHEARWIEKHYTKQFRKQANNSIQCIAIKSKEKNNAEIRKLLQHQLTSNTVSGYYPLIHQKKKKRLLSTVKM